jgi:hypothetical protein
MRIRASPGELTVTVEMRSGHQTSRNEEEEAYARTKGESHRIQLRRSTGAIVAACPKLERDALSMLAPNSSSGRRTGSTSASGSEYAAWNK